MIDVPKVDPRTRQDVVAELRGLIPRYAPTWAREPGRPWPDGDPGAALVEIFARFAEIVIERLNRAPDKNFLAFLDTIGVSLLPPAPARAPVTFTLAAGAVDDAVVPRGMPLATAGADSQNFETERALVVTPARLVSAATLDARRDTYAEHGDGRGAFPPFVGAGLIGHALYLGQSTMFNVARPTRLGVALELGAAPASQLPFLAGLLVSLSWWVRRSGQAARLPATAALGTALRGTAHTAGNANATLTGAGAAFLDELAPGDTLAIPGVGLRRVTGVTNGAVSVDAAVTLPGPPGVVLSRVIGRTLSGTVHTGGAVSTALTGVGTAFTTELHVGDTLVLPGVGTRQVTAIGSAVALTLDAAVTIPGPPGLPAIGVSAPPGVQGTAHTAGIAATTLTGVGSSFTHDVRAGDTLVLPGIGTRQVTAIASDTALTVDAPVTIPGPPGVTLSRPLSLRLDVAASDFAGAEAWTVGGVTSRWLWARTELPLPPATPLPAVTRVSLRSALATPIAPDRAFSNSGPVDLTKGGFFPFGERPRINDTLYLGSEEVLSKANARVTLGVTLSFPINPGGGSDVTLVWEFWDRGTWTPLGQVTSSGTVHVTTGAAQLTDSSLAFTVAGAQTLTFLCPDIQPSEVNGQKNRWVRARIAGGSYGEDAKLVKARSSTTPSLADWDYTAPTLRPPFVPDLKLSYAYETALNADGVICENRFVQDAVVAPFAPFTPPADEDAALYLGFDRPFSNSAFTLYLAVDEQAEPPTSPLVAWEYWDGGAWANVGALDETKALTQPGLVEAIGPADFAASREFGRELHWLRARLEQGQPERFALSGVYPNTVWAVQAITLRGEVLGSGVGKPNQIFPLARAPVLLGQQIEVREPEPPSPEEVVALEADGEKTPVLVVRDDVRKTTEVWVRWHEVDNFNLSGPTSRHYVIERATGRLQFGDGIRGLIPPPGRDNVRAAQYQAGGGRTGNVLAGAITVMKRAVSSVDSVANWFEAGGGADQESLDGVKARGPLVLKHRGRAVAFEDFEWLAQEASIQVARVRCFGGRDATTAGSVTLLLVPWSNDPKPVPSPSLVRAVKDYLDARRTPTADLAILGPAYVDVSVTAEVVPTSFEDADLVRRRVVGNLDAFLHPLTGGPGRAGWEFGRDVFLSEIAAVVEATEGVDHVRRVSLAGRAGADDRTREGGRRVELNDVPGELAAAGHHTITMTAS